MKLPNDMLLYNLMKMYNKFLIDENKHQYSTSDRFNIRKVPV